MVWLYELLQQQQPELAKTIKGKCAWKGDALNRILGEDKPRHVEKLIDRSYFTLILISIIHDLCLFHELLAIQYIMHHKP
ncbi:hypothetical protein ACJX0J_022448, partial [Zea mays]